MENYEIEEEIRERRRECKELEAVDLTGCVSAVFVNALTEFVNNHLIHPDHSENDAVRSYLDETLIFPGLQRLCLRGVKSVAPRILGPSYWLSRP
jgi:hypothetical protein